MQKSIITVVLSIVFVIGTTLPLTTYATIKKIENVEFDKDKDGVKKNVKNNKKSNIKIQEVSNNSEPTQPQSEPVDSEEINSESAVIDGDCTKEGFDRE